MRALFTVLILYTATTYAGPLSGLLGGVTNGLPLLGTDSTSVLGTLLGTKSSAAPLPEDPPTEASPTDASLTKYPLTEVPPIKAPPIKAPPTKAGPLDDLLAEVTKELPAESDVKKMDGNATATVAKLVRDVTSVIGDVKKLFPIGALGTGSGAALGSVANLETASFALVMLLITSLLPTLLPLVDPIIKSLVPLVTPIVTPLAPYIGSVINKITPSIIPLMKPILPSLLPAYLQLLPVFIESVPEMIPSLIKMLTDPGATPA